MAQIAKLLPAVEELKKLFYIDSSIPEGIRWRISSGRRVKKDSAAGCKQNTGYYQTGINGKRYSNHRIIYSIYNNTNLTSEQIVDHLDRCPQNNNPTNLRIVSETENQRNQTKRKNTSSKYIGVSFKKPANKFNAQIGVNGKLIYLGLFSYELEAAKAYNDYIISHNLTHFNLNEI